MGDRVERPADPFTRPTHLKLVLPESVADADALCRAVDEALAQVGVAERPQIGVLGPQELAQVGVASLALPEGSVVSTAGSDDAAANGDEPRLPAALWTGRALDERRSGSGLTALEQDVMAALDRGGDDALESLAVLADWLGRQAETRGHGEVLSMDLRVSSLAAADQNDEAAALRRKLRAARQGLWNAEERTLELIAEGGDAADRPRLDDWAPQLWVEWRGPWLVRLMVRSAWPVRFSEAPALHDRWDMYEKATVPYEHLRRIFALPCARYLSPRRVTLLGSPVTPDLAGRNLGRWSLRDLALVQESMPRTRFTGATLERCRMTDANLQQADLHRATLREIDLRGADLRGADLRGAELAGVDLRCADLRGARLEGLRASDLAIMGARIQPEQRQLLSAAGISEEDLELTAPVR